MLKGYPFSIKGNESGTFSPCGTGKDKSLDLGAEPPSKRLGRVVWDLLRMEVAETMRSKRNR